MYFLISQSDCSDVAMSNILSIIKRTLNLFHIIAPILLMVMATIHLINLIKNPDDKKGLKKVQNSAIAAIVIFFIPTIVNAAMYLLDDSFSVSTCWNSATKAEQSYQYMNPYSTNSPSSVITDPNQYEQGSTSSTTTTTTSGKYYPALAGNTFYFGSSGKTGGCSNSPVIHDVLATVGTKIYAGMDGTLEYSQYVCGNRLYSYGNLAKITDSSTKTYILYAHLSKFIDAEAPVTATCAQSSGGPGCKAAETCGQVVKVIKATRTVKKGELIGYTGNVGNSDGPHLHVEIHENGGSSCVADPYKAMGMK